MPHGSQLRRLAGFVAAVMLAFIGSAQAREIPQPTLPMHYALAPANDSDARKFPFDAVRLVAFDPKALRLGLEFIRQGKPLGTVDVELEWKAREIWLSSGFSVPGESTRATTVRYYLTLLDPAVGHFILLRRSVRRYGDTGIFTKTTEGSVRFEAVR